MSEGSSEAKRPREDEAHSDVSQNPQEGEPPAKKQKIEDNSDTKLTKETEKSDKERDSDDEDDILKSGWLYIDSSGNRQGPFLTRDMQGWYHTGFIIDSLLVRRVDQTSYTPLGTHPILKQQPKPPKQPLHPSMPVQYNPHLAQAYQNDPSAGFEEFTGNSNNLGQAEYLGQGQGPTQSQQDYSQRVMFTSLGGRFKAQDSNTYWQSKGLATDKAGRQMSSFFDVEKYQEEMAEKAAEAEKKKPVKLTKKQIEEFKAKKQAKKVKRILDI